MPKLRSVPVKRLNLIVPVPVYEEIERLAALEVADPYDTPNVSAMARKLLWLGLEQRLLDGHKRSDTVC